MVYSSWSQALRCRSCCKVCPHGWHSLCLDLASFITSSQTVQEHAVVCSKITPHCAVTPESYGRICPTPSPRSRLYPWQKLSSTPTPEDSRQTRPASRKVVQHQLQGSPPSVLQPALQIPTHILTWQPQGLGGLSSQLGSSPDFLEQPRGRHASPTGRQNWKWKFSASASAVWQRRWQEGGTLIRSRLNCHHGERLWHTDYTS